MKMFLLCRALAAGLLMTLSAQAATKTWTGLSLIGSGQWSDAQNWTPAGAPAAGDALVFPANALRLSNTNNLAADTAFGNITLAGPYDLHGNRVTLNGLVTVSHNCDLHLALRLGANVTLSTVGPNVKAELLGNINLNGRSLTLASEGGIDVLGDVNLNGGQLVLNCASSGPIGVVGAISGTGSVTKLGAGRAYFGAADDFGGGSTPNTFNGPTVVQEGTLVLRRRACIPVPTPPVFGISCLPALSIPRDLVIGTALTRASVVLEFDDQISDAAAVTIVTPNGAASPSSLEIGDHNETISSLTLTRGEVSTGVKYFYGASPTEPSPTLTITGNIRVNAAAGTDGISLLTGNIDLGPPRLCVFDVAAGATLQVHGINGYSSGTNVSIVKTNGGTLEFHDRYVVQGPIVLPTTYTFGNGYMGGTDILGGTVALLGVKALGLPSSGTILRSATLNIDGLTNARPSFLTPAAPVEPLELRGPGAIIRSVLHGSNSWLGPITLTDPEARIELSPISHLALRGTVSGPGGFTVIGGPLSLAPESANTFTGTVRVDQATLELRSPSNHVAISGPLLIGNNVGAPGSARVVFGPNTIGTNQIADHVPVTVNTNGLFDLDGHAETIGGLAGAGEVDFGTGGRLTVAGNNQTNIFTGRLSGAGILRKAGTSRLLINGTNSLTGGFELVQGVLAHNGASSNASAFVARNATLTGNGILSSLLTERGGIISPSVSGTNPFTVRVSTRLDEAVFDIQLFGGNRRSHQLRAHGGVLLGNSTLVVTAPLGAVPTNGQRYFILDKTSVGPVDGTFAGLPEGAHFFAAGFIFQITYTGGDGNDIAITRRAGSLLTGLELVGEDYMHIRGQGTNGATYVLEAAPHLLPPIPWTPIATNVASPLGIYELIDLEPFYGTNNLPRHPARFYRVRNP